MKDYKVDRYLQQLSNLERIATCDEVKEFEQSLYMEDEDRMHMIYSRYLPFFRDHMDSERKD